MRSHPSYSDVPVTQRIFVAFSHCVSVIIGIPALIITGSSVIFLICPVISYLICRRYRKIQLNWLSSQAFQGTIANLLLGLSMFVGLEFNLPAGMTLFIFSIAFIAAIYTLWGALDVALGFDFDYINGSRWIDIDFTRDIEQARNVILPRIRKKMGKVLCVGAGRKPITTSQSNQ